MFRILFVSVEHEQWRRQIDAELMRENQKKRDHLQELLQIIIKFVLTKLSGDVQYINLGQNIEKSWGSSEYGNELQSSRNARYFLTR
jgi:hypothetical protein